MLERTYAATAIRWPAWGAALSILLFVALALAPAGGARAQGLTAEKGTWQAALDDATRLARDLRGFGGGGKAAEQLEKELTAARKTMLDAERLKGSRFTSPKAASGAASKLEAHAKRLESLAGEIARQQLQSKTDQKMEELRNRRQEAQTAFEQADQKTNQLTNIMAGLLKNLRETGQAVVRNAGQ